MSTHVNDPRLAAKGGCRVQWRVGTLDLAPSRAAQLMDVCPEGAGLLLKEPLAEGTELSLVLEGPGNAHPVKRIAKVAWCKPIVGGCFADVEFNKRLERAELMSLT